MNWNNLPGTQQSRMFLLLIAVFLATTILVIGKESQKDWKKYQRVYFGEQGFSDSIGVEIISVTPALIGEPELCLTCHMGVEEISVSHPVESFGCVTCHGGDGQTLDADQAHAGLRGGANPSQLSVAEESCGTDPNGTACHAGFSSEEEWRNMVDRVEKSLQATAAGAVKHVQYTFGILDDSISYGVQTVSDEFVSNPNYPSGLVSLEEKLDRDSIMGSLHPKEASFQENCLTGGCHLHEAGIDQSYYHRSSGCASCHVLYDNDGTYKGNDVTVNSEEKGHGKVHEMTVAIPYSQCNHCHNRGIYSMKQMEFMDRTDLSEEQMHFLSAQERREKDYYIPMAEYSQCEVTLDCIDCHTHNEIMGPGDILPEKSEAVEVQCATCHGTVESPPKAQVITSLEQEDVFIADINTHLSPQVGDSVAITQRGTMLPAVKVVDGQWQQVSKVDGTIYPIPLVQESACEQNIEEQDSPSCHRCHDVSDNEIES